METYCFSCKTNTANENSSVRKTRQNKLMLVSKCAGSMLVSNICKSQTKLDVRQPRYTYSACGTSTKHRGKIKKFKEHVFFLVTLFGVGFFYP